MSRKTDFGQMNGHISAELPPQNPEVERDVLGAILLDGGERGVFEHVAEILNVDDFFKPSHQAIFQAMKSLACDNEIIDILSLTDRLGKLDLLKKISSGPLYVSALTDDVPTASKPP